MHMYILMDFIYLKYFLLSINFVEMQFERAKFLEFIKLACMINTEE